MKISNKQIGYLTGVLFSLLACFPVVHGAAPVTSDYLMIPPFVAQDNGKPNVIIALDISGSMKAVAYRDTGAGNWKTGLHDDFDPATKYFGYFESDETYIYDQNNGFFHIDAAGDWNGNFLNWMSMRRIDIVRKVLVGGRVRNRAGENLGGNDWYVLMGQNEPYDYTFRKSYSNSSAYSPIPDGQEVIMSEGKIVLTNSTDSYITTLGDQLEVGRLTMDWTLADPWKEVEFENSYVDPVVVVTAVSFNGAQPVHARVKDVGAAIGSNGGFRARLQEWDYLDGNHTSEELIYIVAERGHHSVPLASGDTLEFDAGSVTTNSQSDDSGNESFYPVLFNGLFSSVPAVFTSVSSHNEVEDETASNNGTNAVVTRMKNVNTASFEVTMQEQESNPLDHVSEDVHYVALSQVTDAIAATGTPIEIGTTPNSVDDNWYTINFATTFPSVPSVALNMQTFNGENTAVVRFGNAVRTETAVDIQIDEEQSDDDETDHINETVSYLAVPSDGEWNIHVGVLDNEPTGIIQDNDNAMRFGLAVYNYDHSKTPTSIYTGNRVDGGTLYPCYPDISLPPADRTNFDICLETHVKSPLSNLIDVVEDHPLVWGTTPIAETLYEIYGYVAQKNNGRNGHAYFYDNGTETNAPGLYPSYKINNTWDPYYYDEYSAKLPCAKTFVLHFNDGAPYDDWNDNSTHPGIPGDADGDGNYSPGSANGRNGNTEMLDDMAYYVRNNDCRDEGDIEGHQEIVSYYVYAALGEGEINNANTRKMREAAANGGFIDKNGNNQPDPEHPANFTSYYNTFLGGGSCETNEWDDDGDCNPDTFYLADNGYELVNQLNAAFESILRRASSGGAASVISAAANGIGAIYQAIFQTSLIDGPFSVAWTGDVNGLFVDSSGNLRGDDGDAVLEDSASDRYIDMCYDTAEKTVRVKMSPDKESRPDQDQLSQCSGAIFTKTLFDIQYLWSGGEHLADLTDAQVLAQRPYTSASPGRHIFTSTTATGLKVDFMPTSFPDELAGLLNASDATEAEKIVNFIRGKDQVGLRSRTIDGGRTWRLGDIVYSTPTAVNRPAEAFDLLYSDASYGSFLAKYKDRRHMVYAGANDGMLHAFNAGWYDSANQKFQKAPSGGTNYGLGEEIWSYVPYNLLPHLKYLADPSYGNTTGNHVNYVDLRPRVFDAKIFSPDATHPNGWGTILVGGMRFGGGTITVDVDTTNPGTDVRTMRSSYFILDITDPDQPPSLLYEFSHPDLGFTTSIPAPFKIGNDWYLLFGSGPSATKTGVQEASSAQNARLFLLNLDTMSLDPDFGSGGIFTLADGNSFISDLVAVDFDLDYSADAIYFGTVEGTGTPWSGKFYRMQTQNNDTSAIAVSSWSPSILLDVDSPISAKPAIALDSNKNRWLLVGTGRFFTRQDASDTNAQKFVGVKETRNSLGEFTWSTATLANMADVSNAEVRENSGNLSGVTLSPALPPSPTFSDLESRMLEYTVDYLDGWYRNLLPSGNRVIGEAAVLGATLTHTSYLPSAQLCSFEGNSELYAVNFSTGTAGESAIIGLTGSADGEGNFLLETKLDLGVAPALTPSLHTGEGYDQDGDSKAHVQTSTGKTIAIEQQNAEPVRSGEQSWRKLN